jgi:hypothetical protein
MTNYLKTLYHLKEVTLQDWLEGLEEAERNHIYDRIPPGKPYGSLGYESKVIDRIIYERQTAQAIAEQTKRQRTNSESKKGNQNARKVKNDDVYNTVVSNPYAIGSTNAKYLTARIARDRPDILERMKAGEFRSVRAAAREAGIVKPTFAIPAEPEGAARIIRKHFTREQTKALRDLLDDA